MGNGGFCAECGQRYDTFEGLSRCVTCGTAGLPCPDKWQVTVSVNWHELRILCMWAEAHQRTLPDTRVVFAIANRLEAQHPELAKYDPLTLARELGQMAEYFGSAVVNDPILRRDVAEQTGQELGLS